MKTLIYINQKNREKIVHPPQHFIFLILNFDKI